jgi:RimJ/RimL family protein N-acetyltransferase
MADHEPDGEVVSTNLSITPDANFPSMILNGTYITLRPLQISDGPALFHSLGGPENAALWKYIPSGPYPDLESFAKAIAALCERTFFFPFVILCKNTSHIPPQLRNQIPNEGVPVGVTCLMSIVPEHHRIEIGHVVYSSLLQRSPATTEASYLLMKLCFELGYERVEWKCNDRNVPSMKAAERLGFVFEGTFRRHLVVKGKRRDTAWYSLVPAEWEGTGEDGKTGCVRGALEAWLGKENFGEDGGQKEKLEGIRERLRAGGN